MGRGTEETSTHIKGQNDSDFIHGGRKICGLRRFVLMEVLVYGLRRSRIDQGHRLEIVGHRGFDGVQRHKSVEQGAFTFVAYAGDTVQHRIKRIAVVYVAVVTDGETVRFVPQPLD